MPGQDNSVFDRPVTRSQSKRIIVKTSKTPEVRRQTFYGPAAYEYTSLHSKKKWSSSSQKETLKGSKNKTNGNDKSNRTTLKNSKDKINKNAVDSPPPRCPLPQPSSQSYHLTGWIPETPEYTPDCLSEYGFEDVFDQAFATALNDGTVYTNTKNSSSCFAPLSPLSPHSSNEAENSDVDIEDEEIIDIESLSPPKMHIQIDDIPLKYRLDLESETSSDAGGDVVVSPLCSPEYTTPETSLSEQYDTPMCSTTSEADILEKLVSLDGECVNPPFSLVEQKQPMTRDLLIHIKNGLDLEDTEQAMFWCLCTLAFHSLARLNELVTDKQSKDSMQIEVEQVKAPKVYVVPYACIRIPYYKNENAKIRHLVVSPSNNEICPLTALSNYCRIRTQEGYASDQDPFFCLKGGKVASRKWFLDTLQPLLPNGGGTTRYSFRAGGVLDLVAQGRTKPDIRCLGRWDCNAFEQYLNEHPAILLAFISASISNAYQNGDSVMMS